MLTSETKQKINNCRDYLVGKIPDPKGQIDQITNALIYKFMSDQDRLAKEIGGNASFFVDQGEKESEKYEKYSWEHLFDTKLTNEAKARLYIDGIEQLSKAKHLPELFRDIFKNAFLPFRDANTIVLFLTEINKFDYHHSEELGNAFEYLLSIMGSQGNAGQFRTPRHIIEFLVDVVDPKPGETIYDPACGTAGFLISAFTHIMENNPKLSVPEKLELYKNISGVDIDPGMAKIARVNLYLHGFKTPIISEDDTLSNIKLWDNKYDVILANPPFMTPKGGIKVHEGYSIKSTKAEVLFTDYIAEHLRLKGRAGIIVPEGIIFQSANAYKDLRKMLVEQNLLYSVVSLPSGIFQPYSGVKTSILFLDRELAAKTDKVLFVKVENDGYDLGAQRRPINKDDLPKSLEILRKYKRSVLENTSFEIDDKNVLVVEKSKIAQTGEYNLSGERYRETIAGKSSFDMVELGEVCDIYNGSTPLKSNDEYWINGNIPWFTIEDIRKQGRIINETSKFITEKALKETSVKLLPKNSILLCCTASIGEYAISKINLTTNQQFNGIVVKEEFINKLNPEYLFWIVSKFKEDLIRLSGQTSFNFLPIKTLKSFKIPLPPLEIQEEIVEELDNYQKIINGAKQIVENYKPKFKIDKSWEIVELGEIGKINMCKRIFKEETNPYKGIPFYKIGTFGKEPDAFINEELFNDYKNRFSYPKKGDILISTSGTIGRIVVFDGKPAYFQDSNIVWIDNNESKILNRYLYIVFQEINWITTKGGTIERLYNKLIEETKISIPPLEIQEQIVAKIEEEQKMVESAKGLIKVFENKIKERIGEVWGEK